MPDILNSLNKISDLEVGQNVPLADHTAWKVGGPARFLVHAGSSAAVEGLLEVTGGEDVPLIVFGRGSNLLVSDEGIPGVVLILGGDLVSIKAFNDGLEAGAGALLSSAVFESLRASLAGLEFTFGIPGTVGGAVMTNAGAFSGTIARVLDEVHTLNRRGKPHLYNSFKETYREPLVPADKIVMGVKLKLGTDETENIRNRMDSVRAKRRATQPWGMSTAGSVFKNPPGDSAGRLIEKCGFKGRTHGGAKVSEIHSNFIINDGAATASDIKQLIDLIREEVKGQLAVDLELEVQLVGFSRE